jgi:hypothetical protein
MAVAKQKRSGKPAIPPFTGNPPDMFAQRRLAGAVPFFTTYFPKHESLCHRPSLMETGTSPIFFLFFHRIFQFTGPDERAQVCNGPSTGYDYP